MGYQTYKNFGVPPPKKKFISGKKSPKKGPYYINKIAQMQNWNQFDLKDRDPSRSVKS